MNKEADYIISYHLFNVAQKLLNELNKEPKPIKYGRGQYFKSFLIKLEVISGMYSEENMPWLYGYAEYMKEFADTLENTEIEVFVSKKRH